MREDLTNMQRRTLEALTADAVSPTNSGIARHLGIRTPWPAATADKHLTALVKKGFARISRAGPYPIFALTPAGKAALANSTEGGSDRA